MFYLKKCLKFLYTHQFLILKLVVLVLGLMGEDGPPRG